MKRVQKVALTLGILTAAILPLAVADPIPAPSSFATDLSSRVVSFDVKDQTFAQAFLNLVYTYHLPAALEYVDQNAVKRPLRLRRANITVRDALVALVAQLPEYHVDFSQGLVDVYSPQARSDHSNVPNTVIPKFAVTDETPRGCLWNLWEALDAKLRPGTGFPRALSRKCLTAAAVAQSHEQTCVRHSQRDRRARR